MPMQTVRLPLPQILATRNANVTKDGLLVNCYKEATPIGDMIVKRPGYTLAQSFTAGCAQGGITYNGQGLFVVGDAISSGLSTVNGASWTLGASDPFTGARIGSAMCSMGGVLFLSGGSGTGAAQIFSDVWKSIDNGTTWSQVNAGATFGNRAFHQMVALNGVLYVMGGYTVKSGSALSTVVATVYKSTDSGVTWTASNSMTTARALFGACSTGSAIIVSSGIDNTATTLRSVESSAGGAWTSIAGTPGWNVNQGGSLAFMNGSLYFQRGSTLNGYNNAVREIWLSTNGGSTWTQLTPTATWAARSQASMIAVGSTLYLFGGINISGTSLNDVCTSTDGTTWTQVTAGAGWAIRGGMAATSHNGTVYLYGGGTQNVSSAFTPTQSNLFYAAVTTGAALSPAPPVSCLPFQITLIPASGSIPVKVFLKNANVAYVWDGLTLTAVTDADYPPLTVYGVVYLDGTIYVMDAKGQINGSDLNAPTSWSALNFITANAEADAGVALVRQLNYIVAFKQYSTEFFYDAGNAVGSPLAKVLNALLEIGLATSGSLAFADNTIYFMANARQKGRSIMKMDGYTPKLISTPYIDRILNSDSLSEVYAFVVKSNGHFFYVLTLVNSALTLVFDEASGEWHTWTKMTAGSPQSVATAVAVSTDTRVILFTMGLPHGQSDGDIVVIAGATPSTVNGQFNIRYDSTTMSPLQFSIQLDAAIANPITGSITATFYTESYFPAVYYAYGNSQDLMLDKSTGQVYTFSPSTYQDNGNPINTMIRTATIDMNVMASKRYSRFELVGDKVTTNIYTRYSNDDYQSWSLYRQIKMNASRAMLSNLGSARRRSFEIKHTENTELRLLAAEIDFDMGSF